MRTNQLEEFKNPIQRAGSVVKAFSVAFIGAALIAALYVRSLAFGGRINFWQALAVYLYAAVPTTAISKVLSLVILFIKAQRNFTPFEDKRRWCRTISVCSFRRRRIRSCLFSRALSVFCRSMVFG